MKLPNVESCNDDSFLLKLRLEDERGFLSKNKSKNQAFLDQRRVTFSIELMKKFLPKQVGKIKIADFACGLGNFGCSMLDLGYEVTFIDNEPKFFEYIKLKSGKEKIKSHFGDCSQYIAPQSFDAIFFGEALEHMSNPAKTVTNLRENLNPGGLLCLTTPNGDYIDCYEPNWHEVKDQPERNDKLANSIGNHVCEFTVKELKDILKENGFNILHHQTFLSKQISKKSLLRRVFPISFLNLWDLKLSKKFNKAGKNFGRTQIVLAQRAH
jgi:2-polyprenyl-3-methyl-5-hydroxy-6-metoxy-1,4-benzoquinol methylase